jgi:hypothetical protein
MRSQPAIKSCAASKSLYMGHGRAIPTAVGVDTRRTRQMRDRLCELRRRFARKISLIDASPSPRISAASKTPAPRPQRLLRLTKRAQLAAGRTCRI